MASLYPLPLMRSASVAAVSCTDQSPDSRRAGRPGGARATRAADPPHDPSDYARIDQAAARLAMTPIALRARCRRAARREGRSIVAHLGAGVVAYKFGRSWRVR